VTWAGGGRASGNAEGDRRDEGSADDGVVGRLRSGDALGKAGAEKFLAFREAFGLIVGEPAGRVAARSRNDADKYPDESRADDSRQDEDKFLPTGKHFVGELAYSVGCLLLLGNELYSLGDGEEADEGDDEGNARIEVDVAEGEAGRAGYGIDAHLGEKEAENSREQPHEYRAAAEGSDDRDAEDGDAQEFEGSELKGEGAEQRSYEKKGEAAYNAANKGSDE